MNVPNLVFWFLSTCAAGSLAVDHGGAVREMFGYGFGFVGMILFIMQVVASGNYQTAHYALGSGFMQLGFVLFKCRQRRHPAGAGLPPFLPVGAGRCAAGADPVALHALRQRGAAS